MSYEKKFAKDGTPIYFKNGKRVKKASVPVDQLLQWSHEASAESIRDMGITVKDMDSPQPMTVDEPTPQSPTIKYEIPYRECIVCQAEGTRQRAYNSQVLYLCEDHYISTTLGKIAQLLRERQTA